MNENKTKGNLRFWALVAWLLRKEKRKCPHKKTVALNEEGYAGIYCTQCGEQLEKEC